MKHKLIDINPAMQKVGWWNMFMQTSYVLPFLLNKSFSKGSILFINLVFKVIYMSKYFPTFGFFWKVKCAQIRSFFWSVFSRIWTEYREIRSISSYSVRMRENTEQKKLRIWTFFTQWLLQLKSLSFHYWLNLVIGLVKVEFQDWFVYLRLL